MNNLGKFKICTKCQISKNCCCNFDKINYPVLNQNEINKIKKNTKYNDFYHKVNDNLYYLKVKNNKCIFYQNHKCIIYKYRSLDCKLYPFDIIKKQEKYYLIVYFLECLNQNEIVKNSHSIDKIIKQILPWINEFTDSRNYTKMKNIKYRIIKEINYN